jgi:hypothetical protein
VGPQPAPRKRFEGTMLFPSIERGPMRPIIAACAAAFAWVACSTDTTAPASGTIPDGSPAIAADGGSNGSPPATAADAASGTALGADAATTGGSVAPGGNPAPDGGAPPYVWPSDCETHYTMLAHNNAGASDTAKKQVAAGAQYYASYYYSVPWGAQDVQGLKFRTIIDNTKIVHHWILYGVNSATEQNGAVQGGEGQPIGSMAGEFYIAGWAPGAPDIELPEGVGLHMPTGPNAMLRLEIHYFNTAPSAAAEVDASGVEFCVTSHKRAQEAAIHWLGSTNINVPAHGKVDVKSTCRPRVTNGPIHLMSLSSHMHKAGVHSSAILKRANGGAPVTLIDDPFSFLEQSGFKQPRDGSAPDVQINAGDTIDVTCSFDNTTDKVKAFGSNTEDEMCFFYAMAWPRGQLSNGALFSIVPGATQEVNCIQ